MQQTESNFIPKRDYMIIRILFSIMHNIPLILVLSHNDKKKSMNVSILKI